MPRNFSNQEYADIHYIYGFCDGNAGEGVQEYHRRFPGRIVPDRRVFIQTHRKFCEVGFGKTVINDRHRRIDPRVTALFDQDPTLSTRRVAAQLNFRSHVKVWRSLKNDYKKPYHLQPVQGLHPEDYDRRVRFCTWMLESVALDPNFLEKILWTDEAGFTRAGVVNYHNLHVWAHENPHTIRPANFQNEFSCNVWVGLMGNQICGPHFLPPRLNGVLFHQFLEEDLEDLLEDVPLNQRIGNWIQMDGAPAHSARQVTEWLDTNYPQRWIGRYRGAGQNEDLIPVLGPVNWPARSPDLNPLDFWFWGHIKGEVYQTAVNTVEELQDRIIQSTNNLKNQRHQTSAATNALVKRCRKCIEVRGGHFEHLI